MPMERKIDVSFMPKNTLRHFSYEGERPVDNVFIVDKEFLISRLGARLASTLETYHAAKKKLFRLFLRAEVQQFAQASQSSSFEPWMYPFVFSDPCKRDQCKYMEQ